MVSLERTVGRAGRSYERFDGRGKGYDIVRYAVDPSTGLVGGERIGHAVKVIDHWGRHQGWIVLDLDSGEVILGAGDSTRIGRGLDDALFMFEQEIAPR